MPVARTLAALIMALFLAGSAPQAGAAELQGGCRAKGGKLPPGSQKELAAIVAMIDRGKDMAMLAKLHRFLKSDTRHKELARPQIQRVLLSVIDRLFARWTEQNSRWRQTVFNLTDFYPTAKGAFPRYSFEAVISRELLFILGRAARQREIEVTGRIKEPKLLKARILALQPILNRYERMISQVAVSTLFYFEERPLDQCARQQLWGFAQRLLDGGPYYKKGGIEEVEPVMGMLNRAQAKEKSPQIKALGARVLALARQRRQKAASKEKRRKSR